ncbi:Ser/Thr protein phosphatase protein [Auriculariales sp. MPI-PUGE-AT-0066]|nr:Ser/Thr protein phosphatase protein [Auriculariales sp. MPI-PUGE-AT-0066]
MPTQLQIMSDLHLEMERGSHELYNYDIQPQASTLILLGDIGYTISDELFTWFEQQLLKFVTVVFVPGNHEPYWASLSESTKRLEDFAVRHSTPSDTRGRFILLNRSRFDLTPTITLLGCTLWAKLDPEELDLLSFMLTDFKRIKDLNPSNFSAEHARDLEWLNGAVQDIAANEPERSIVILTHHAPTTEGVSNPRYRDGPTKSGWATELTAEPCWNADIVRLWAFGHTHFSCDLVRNGIRVYSNQRGYKDGEGLYNPNKVITL